MIAPATFVLDDKHEQDPAGIEGLVLMAMRRWAAGRVCWEVSEDDFRRVFGPADGPVALLTIAQLLIRICLHSRRPLRFGIIGVPWVSADETFLLQLLAAAQLDDRAQMALRLEWLFPHGVCSDAPDLLHRVAAILTLHGHRLPLRSHGE